MTIHPPIDIQEITKKSYEDKPYYPCPDAIIYSTKTPLIDCQKTTDKLVNLSTFTPSENDSAKLQSISSKKNPSYNRKK